MLSQPGPRRVDRPQRLMVLMTPHEKRMLRVIATRQGLTLSTAIRLLVRGAYEGIVAVSD